MGDVHQRRGVTHLRVLGKGSKLRYVPLHPSTAEAIDAYIQAAGHAAEVHGGLFRPLHGRGNCQASITSDGVYKMLSEYAVLIKLNIIGFGPHSLRATAATNALDHYADIAKVQEWLGHANIATTRLYDRRATRVEDSPTFKVIF